MSRETSLIMSFYHMKDMPKKDLTSLLSHINHGVTLYSRQSNDFNVASTNKSGASDFNDLLLVTEVTNIDLIKFVEYLKSYDYSTLGVAANVQLFYRGDEAIIYRSKVIYEEVPGEEDFNDFIFPDDNNVQN